MLPELRAYERLSPELVLLAESHNTNVEGTLITDYLVTGARGYDWLLQIHRDAVIVDFEDMPGSLANMKSAVDELVEYPSIIRVLILVEGDKRTPMFVVTDLGAEGPEMVTNINALLEKKNKTMTDKHTFVLNIPADCDDPVGYVHEAIESFQASQGKLAGDIAVKINTENPNIRETVRKGIPDISVIDELPAGGDSACGQLAEQSENATSNIDNVDKARVVAYDGVAEYTGFIRQWVKDRNIIGGGSTTLDQFIKGLTEAGELWTHIGKGQRELLKDDIGDIYVCLVNAAGNLDINLEDSVRVLEPHNVHVGRVSYKAKGLKRWSLQVLYNMAVVAQSIENILDSDNECDVEFFKTDFADACADVVYVLETIALEQGWSLTECVAAAYEDIRDRKGLMLSGTFIKEKDFTHEMVKHVLAEDTTTEGTREYLNTWLGHNRAESMDDADQVAPAEAVAGGPASATVETKKPFWRVWNDAQGNKENLAPFDLTEDISALLNKAEGDQIVTTLGVFGQPNHNGEVFVIDDTKLKARLDALVGMQVGETDNPTMQEGQSEESWLERVSTLDPVNSAGVLLDYAITVLGEGEHGPIIEVVGLVEPSAFTKDRIATAGSVYFGIRGLVTTRYGIRINHVNVLAGFDLSIENPRQLIK